MQDVFHERHAPAAAFQCKHWPCSLRSAHMTGGLPRGRCAPCAAPRCAQYAPHHPRTGPCTHASAQTPATHGDALSTHGQLPAPPRQALGSPIALHCWSRKAGPAAPQRLAAARQEPVLQSVSRAPRPAPKQQRLRVGDAAAVCAACSSIATSTIEGNAVKESPLAVTSWLPCDMTQAPHPQEVEHLLNASPPVSSAVPTV